MDMIFVWFIECYITILKLFNVIFQTITVNIGSNQWNKIIIMRIYMNSYFYNNMHIHNII